MANILRIDPESPDQTVIATAAAHLRAGGLVAFPTETVYGLGADATNPVAVRRIFAAKGRPSTDPLIVHVLDVHAVAALVSRLPEIAHALAARFWPGPLTLVLPRSPIVSDLVTAGLDTVAVRSPSHPVARALIRAAQRPLAAPSANLFSRPSPTLAAHVNADLGDRIDLILDAGPTTVGVESTVIDLTSAQPEILRPGGVAIEAIREIVPNVVFRSAAIGAGTAMPSPGMLTRHYAPHTPLTLFEGAQDAIATCVVEQLRAAAGDGQRVVLACVREVLDVVRQQLDSAGLSVPAIVDLGTARDLDDVAANLYMNLRACDAHGAGRILAVQVHGTGGIVPAIQDRLRRASAGDIVTCLVQSSESGSSSSAEAPSRP